MSDITREEREALHRFGDVLERNFSQRPVAAVTRKTAVVRSVDHDQARLNVLCDGDDAPLVGVRCTTACAGVSVGDTVLVETFRGASIVTSVLAKSLDNVAYVRSGKLVMTPVPGETVSRRVDFDEPFTGQPVVVTNPMTSAPDRVMTAAASVDEGGFTLYLYRDGSTATSVMWLAVLP